MPLRSDSGWRGRGVRSGRTAHPPADFLPVDGVRAKAAAGEMVYGGELLGRHQRMRKGRVDGGKHRQLINAAQHCHCASTVGLRQLARQCYNER